VATEHNEPGDVGCSRQDLEAERTVLGAILLTPSAFTTVAARVQVLDFFSLAHRCVFAVMHQLVDRGEEIHYGSVKRELERHGAQNPDGFKSWLDEVGVSYLTGLTDGVPRSLNVDYFCGVIVDCALVRRHEQFARNYYLETRHEEGLQAATLTELLRTELQELEQRATAATTSPFVSVRDVITTSPLIDWIVYGYLPTGAITEIVGPPKLSGKTTLALDWCWSVLHGQLAMGQCAVRSTRIVYCTEQSQESFAEHLRRASLCDRDENDMRVLSRWHPSIRGLKWPGVVAEVTRECERIDADLAIFDTLTAWSDLVGDEENMAAAAQATLKPLQRLAATGRAVLVLRHARKSGGGVGQSGRGSSAFSGSVDILLNLERPEGQTDTATRVLTSEGRYDKYTPKHIEIEWVDEMADLSSKVSSQVSSHARAQGGVGWNERKRYRVVESSDATEEARVRRTLRNVLPTTLAQAVSVEHLTAETGLPKTTLKRVLDHLPGVVQSGPGTRGRPYKFHFLPPHQIPSGGNLGGNNQTSRPLSSQALWEETESVGGNGGDDDDA
jgi:AAA domain/DnaB-like helicase N terminal domain